ncbi:unnamed protein product [Cuscuta campestris]|uniref:CCHC-type domain-containing protein n=1 Tax=Cuscuta campestris TaxID=132261 RepID=A0A484KZ97_9ASTE|nr:unnamed protein product [Cuscuta campestris]
MWEKLEVTYEGTAQVREAKIDQLTHEYELFSMKENEKIEEMFERFSNIINPLNLLGKTYTDRELVRKVLRSLSPKWCSKVDTIEEGCDFQTMTYDALRGNIITYETTQLSKVVEERSKRSIALPATTSTHNNVDDEDDDNDDTDLGVFVRKFKKMMLKKGAKKNTPPKCYGCGEIGHIKPMCPKLKNEKDKREPKKQRAYISWENDGSGIEDSETEEVANLCLMAIEDGETSKETEDEYDAQDIKKVENNAKAINIIYCAVNPDDYRKISCCTTAKEMWDKLEITYEGTDQVREAKIDFLTHEYELFRMKENEKIDEMFERFSKIVNDLHALKKTYTDKELVRKILRSLTPEWRSKDDAIQESIGITNVTIDGLRGNLKTYESTILFPSLGEQKKKGIALKATSSQEPAIEESSDEDNEFGLVIKKFHKFMRKEYERKGKKHGGTPKCYGCGEVGHIKPKCPNAKNEKEKKPFKKHRAYISWGADSGDESSEGEENESANLCLMAHEEPPEEVCTTSKDSYTFDDVQEAFNELYDEYVNASKINKDLKKQLTSMEKEVDKLSKDNEKLKEENKFFGKRSTDKPESSKCSSCISLKDQVAKLEGTLKKFGVSHKNLNDVLDNLQLTKHGLGGQRKHSRTGKNVASSSAPPPPAHKYLDGSFLWFNDREEATRFSKKFEHREILPPRFSTARFIHDSIPREARIILERGNFLDLLYIKKGGCSLVVNSKEVPCSFVRSLGVLYLRAKVLRLV